MREQIDITVRRSQLGRVRGTGAGGGVEVVTPGDVDVFEALTQVEQVAGIDGQAGIVERSGKANQVLEHGLPGARGRQRHEDRC